MKRLLVILGVLLFCACGNSDTQIDKYAQIIQACDYNATICHFPPGNPGNAQTITVGHPSILAAHLKHGDHLGECTCKDFNNCYEDDCDDDNCCEDDYHEDDCCEDDCDQPPLCGSGCPQIPRCGDETCNGNETCETCPLDCGECLPRCGDEECNGNETCATCTIDCGKCPPECGDEVCNINETCETCPIDCGECPPLPPECGDETCDIGESCDNCIEDCGDCPVSPEPTPDAGIPDAGVIPPTPNSPQFAVTGGCNTVGLKTGNIGVFFVGFLFMALGAFFWVRQRRILGILIFVAGLVIAGSSNRAHAFPTQNLKPAVGTSDYWQTEDVKLSLPSVKLLWHYENDPLALENLNTGEKVTLINHRQTLHLMGAYTFYNRVQIGADIPLVLGQWNGDLTGLGASDATGGIANIRLMVKVLIAKWDHIAVGVGIDTGLPTSTVPYVDDADWTVTPKAMASGYIGPVSLAINAGVRLRDPDSFTPTGINKVVLEHEFVGSMGAQVDIWNNDTFDINVVSDIFLHVPLAGAENRTIPVELINGVKIGLPAGFAFNAGVGVGLTHGVGAPDYRLLGGLTWAYEPNPCVLKPVYKINVVQGPPIVEEVPYFIPVPIINPVYFPFDKSELTLEAQATLLDDIKAIRWAKDNGMTYRVILLIGRTDKRGSEEYNIDLAQARAKSVQAFLIDNGFDAEDLDIQVDGESEADQDTTDELKFQQDRTVIIKLVTE